MRRGILVTGIILTCTLASSEAQTVQLSMRALMTPVEFQAAGLAKLSPSELASLDRWITRFASTVLIMNRPAPDQSGGCEEDGTAIVGDHAVVLMALPSCHDYFLADGPHGQYLLEWYGGHSPSRDDQIIGPINSYGFKEVCYPGHGRGRVYVDDYLLSKTSATEKYAAKCR